MGFELALGSRIRKSPFFDATVRAGVSHLTVYNHMYMPVSYGDRAAEYRRLTEGVAMWDVGVERQVEIRGPDAERLVRYLVPRELGEMHVGQGKYVPLCDHDGRLLNDPVLLKIDRDTFWFSIADSDVLMWSRAIAAERGLDVTLVDPEVAPLAVQGPRAEDVVAALFGDWVRDLKYFWFRAAEIDSIPLIVARSGWSKQGGFELYLRDPAMGTALWDRVASAGAAWDIGPGAPNYVERIESGLLSYGADTDVETNPFEVGLGKFVSLERTDDFIGKEALRRIRDAGIRRRLTGLVVAGEPLPPNPHPFPAHIGGRPVGKVTAVAYSPRLARNVAVGLLQADAAAAGTELTVETDEGVRTAVAASLPFL